MTLAVDSRVLVGAPDLPGADVWAATPAECAALAAGGDFYAAGLLLGSDRTAVERHAAGIERHVLCTPLPAYGGERLYPAGRGLWTSPPGGPRPAMEVGASYVSLDICMNADAAHARSSLAHDPVERSAYSKLAAFCERYPRGGGWTHGIIHYERVLAEGLAAYEARANALATSPDPRRAELGAALSRVVRAIDALRLRIVDHLDAWEPDSDDGRSRRDRLVSALRSGIPMRPARGFFEAMTATQLLFAIDGSDNLGRFDQFMLPYYLEGTASADLDRGAAVDLVGELWAYIDACTGWNVALGGTTDEGREASNPLTLVCLEAARGRRRPNLALRLRRDTPDEVWDAALDVIGTGCGLPALYSEENYDAAIGRAGLSMAGSDRCEFAFGGCTELMVQGRSNVGSLDGDLNVLQVFDRSLHERLLGCATYEEFLAGFADDLRLAAEELSERVNHNQQVRADLHPQLIRTLLVDDCIERGLGFSEGGARYNWSVLNIVGLSNVIDSMAAVRHSVYEQRSVASADLLAALHDDFVGHEDVLASLQRGPRFGNDDARADDLAKTLSTMVFGAFDDLRPWRGGRFLCGTLMFVTYGWYGLPVGATPDGRRAGAPVGDSAGPVQGRDRTGPTAMLRSVAAQDLRGAAGTPVVNIRVARDLVTTTAGRAKLKALIRGYFELGGMQLQVNVVDQETLRDAIQHPERHGDLIVRVGGYSEYFNHLPDDLKWTILERTEHQ